MALDGVVEGTVVQGIGVSSGSAYAPVMQVGAAVRPPADEAVLETEEAARVIREALEAVAVEIERRSALASDNAAEILGATAMLARDPGLVDGAIAHAVGQEGPRHGQEGPRHGQEGPRHGH